MHSPFFITQINCQKDCEAIFLAIYLGVKIEQKPVIVKKAPISYFLLLGFRLKYIGHHSFRY